MGPPGRGAGTLNWGVANRFRDPISHCEMAFHNVKRYVSERSLGRCYVSEYSLGRCALQHSMQDPCQLPRPSTHCHSPVSPCTTLVHSKIRAS